MGTRRLIARCWIKFQRHTPDMRGKQWLSRMLNNWLGPVPLKSSEGVWLHTRLSSSMDLSYLDRAGGGHCLIRQAITELKQGEKMLDIGANTGYISMLAARQVGPEGLVIAVEPSQREFQLLLENLKLNQCDNILALNIAGGDRAKQVLLTIESDHTGLNKIIEVGSMINRQPCQVMPLADLALGNLALVKIDVEGYELFTLRGLEPLLRKQQVKRLVVEISPAFLQNHGHSASEVYGLLEEYGYNSTINPTGLQQWDEIFVCGEH